MFAKKCAMLLLLSAAMGTCSITLAVPQVAAKSKPKSQRTTPAAATGDDAAIRAQIASLVKDLSAGDAKAVALLFTEGGQYTDENGNESKGRAQLEQQFSEVFAQDGRPNVELVANNISFMSPDVALAEGQCCRKESGEAVTRFSLLFLKVNNNWFISRATESPVATSSNYDNLRDLDWLIGDWTAQRDGATLKMNATWTQNKNFIICKYLVKKPNAPEQIDMQVIGWDPIAHQPISWSFDSNGGFGHGQWSRQAGGWTIDTDGVARDGTTTKSKNVLAKDGTPNAFSWSSMNRIVDGVAVGDIDPLKVQRTR